MRAHFRSSRHPLAIAIALSGAFAATPALAAPEGVPCPEFPDLQDPTYKPVSYLCGMDVLSEDMYIAESLEAYDATIRTRRNAHIALYLQWSNRGYLVMDNVDILMGGRDNSAIVFSSNNPLGARINDVRIRLQGDRMVGISAGVAVPDANGELNPANTMAISDSRIDIEGADGWGMGSGMHNLIDATRLQIDVRGDRARAYSQWAGEVRMRDSSVRASGADARAYHLVSSRLTWPGKPTYAYTPYLLLEGSTVTAQGEGSVGMLAEYVGSLHAGMGARIHLEDSAIHAHAGDALRINGGAANRLDQRGGALMGRDAGLHLVGKGTVLRALLSADAAIASTEGASLRLGDETALDLEAAGSRLGQARDATFIRLGEGARGRLDVSGSILHGGVERAESAHLDVTLRDGSQWRMSGDNRVDQLHIQGSTLSLANGSSGDRLRVMGDLRLDDGRILLDTVLAGDDAATDFIRVDGDLSGHGTLQVNNAGGQGANTVRGIQVVSVGGASSADLVLAGRAVGGIYEYFLHRDADDGGWYLRSQQLEQDPCLADPGLCVPPVEDGGDNAEGGALLPETGDGGRPAPFVTRPEVGAYLANQVEMRRLLVSQRSERVADATGATVTGWVNTGSSQVRFATTEGQLQIRSERSRAQVGGDLGVFDEGRGRLGVSVSSGRAVTRSVSQVTGFDARGSLKGVAAAVHGSWALQRFHLDGWLQRATVRQGVEGLGLSAERQRGHLLQLGLETGGRLGIGHIGDTSLSLLPEVQLVYTDARMRTHIESNGTVVRGLGGSGLSSRVGLQLRGDAVSAHAATVSPYLLANWYRERRPGDVTFDDVLQRGVAPHNRYETGAGARLGFTGGWSAQGSLRLVLGDSGYRETRGELALSRRW